MRHEHLLLVEVDPPSTGWYELFLSARGFVVATASSAGLALRAAAADGPRIIVIGRLADGTDAGTLAERLRGVTGAAAIIVAMSDRIGDIPAADVVIPIGSPPRAVLDAIRTAARARRVRDVERARP